MSPFYGLIKQSNCNYFELFLILATIPLNPLNCTFYRKLSASPAKYGNLLLYLRCFHFFLSKLSEKAYKRCHGHCDRKCCSSFGRFSYLAKSLLRVLVRKLKLVRVLFQTCKWNFWTSEIFVLRTVHEPVRVHGGDPSLEVRVAATDIAQSIYKHLSIKSQRTPLNSFTKGAFSGFPILYSS